MIEKKIGKVLLSSSGARSKQAKKKAQRGWSMSGEGKKGGEAESLPEEGREN